MCVYILNILKKKISYDNIKMVTEQESVILKYFYLFIQVHLLNNLMDLNEILSCSY